jgi:hypothetical protein
VTSVTFRERTWAAARPRIATSRAGTTSKRASVAESRHDVRTPLPGRTRLACCVQCPGRWSHARGGYPAGAVGLRSLVRWRCGHRVDCARSYRRQIAAPSASRRLTALGPARDAGHPTKTYMEPRERTRREPDGEASETASPVPGTRDAPKTALRGSPAPEQVFGLGRCRCVGIVPQGRSLVLADEWPSRLLL